MVIKVKFNIIYNYMRKQYEFLLLYTTLPAGFNHFRCNYISMGLSIKGIEGLFANKSCKFNEEKNN